MTTRTGRIWLLLLIKITLLGGLFLFMAGAGSLCYFQFAPPEQTCLSCHEIRAPYDRWASSAHREVSCKRCHGGSLTAGIHGIQENLHRVVAHFRDTAHEDMRLSEEQVVEMTNQCLRCHPREFVHWRAGGHGITYSDIFLNPEHNHTEQVADDCLRCHGMFFPGRAADVVTPLDTTGPWQLRQVKLATRPVIPCLACHQIHVAGHPFSGARSDEETKDGAAATERRGTIALYSRRERTHFAAADLPIPSMQDHGRPVLVSTDPRQRLCVQCHAPNAFHQVGTGDDRTPTGVHEGLSCAACHAPHSNDARGSCVQCHPKFSHCGLDVMKMDTSYRSRLSAHNIHHVQCTDCHPGGAPKTPHAPVEKEPAAPAARDKK
jgi:nitrate reductase cytochrome c-type subunit